MVTKILIRFVFRRRQDRHHAPDLDALA